MSFVNLENIRVSYDRKTTILEELNLSIEKGELVSLLGPSGCGKTTTLRVIAGLIEPDQGTFALNNQDLTKIPVHKRNFGMVFQSYALFPHLTIAENVAFGLKLRKESKENIQRKVADMLKICGLEGFEKRYPKQLSGGQRQRVALARALVIEPELLLLDEPLSNLDAKLRIAMRIEIKRIQQELGITTVFVTHDQEECFSISDKVAVMNKGVIEQYAAPEEIYRKPSTKFVAHFIGFENFFPLTHIKEQQYRTVNGELLETFYGSLPHQKIVGTIRPDDIEIITGETEQNVIRGKVLVRTFLGKSYQYEIQTELGKFLVNGNDKTIYNVQDSIQLAFPKEKLVLLEDKA